MPYPSRGAWVFSNVTKGWVFWPRLSGTSITIENPEALANLDCEVVDGDSSLDFDVEDEVVVTFRGVRIFAGHLKAITENQADEFGPRIWKLSAQDYTAKLDDAIVRRRTPRKEERAKRRVRWLLGYMRGNIWELSGKDLDGMPAANPILDKYDYHGNSVREALDQVAEEAGLNFYIDFDNVAHVFRSEVYDSPFDLDNVAPDYATSFPFRSWDHTLDSESVGNAVLVEPEKRDDSRWARDAVSIAAYGRQERFIGDSELASARAAQNVASRTLEGIRDPTREATLECWEPGLLPGQRVDVTEALWGHVAERFWIRRVEIRPVDPHDESGEAYLLSTVTIAERLIPTRRRSGRSGGSGNNENTAPGTSTDTGGHPVVTFPDPVSPPALVTGSAAGSFGVAGQARGSRTFGSDGSYSDTAFTWINGNADRILMAYNSAHGHTSRPPFTMCSGLDYAFTGFAVREQWFKLTVPAHPADAAGIRVTVNLGSAKAYAQVAGVRIVARSSQPTALGQGTLVSTALSASSTSILIPVGSIPAAGGVLWIGLLPGWTTTFKEDTFRYGCGFPSPALAYSYDLDSAGVGYRGRSGEMQWLSLASATWMTWDATSPDLGTIATGGEDSPWLGGNAIKDAGSEGAGDAWSFGHSFEVAASTPSGKGFYVDGSRDDDEQADGPWSDGGWGHTIHFTIDAHGETSDPGTRQIQTTTTGEGEQSVGTVHTGDGEYAEGISVSSPSVTVYAAKALTLDEEWVARFDTRSGELRGKLWRAADGEPATWDVSVPLDETDDELDRWMLWIRSGNDGTLQTTRVDRVVGFASGSPGQRVVYEVLGYASGAVRTFQPSHRYRVGQMRPYINGIAAGPSEVEDGESFTLDFWPTPRSVVGAAYVID